MGSGAMHELRRGALATARVPAMQQQQQRQHHLLPPPPPVAAAECSSHGGPTLPTASLSDGGWSSRGSLNGERKL